MQGLQKKPLDVNHVGGAYVTMVEDVGADLGGVMVSYRGCTKGAKNLASAKKNRAFYSG